LAVSEFVPVVHVEDDVLRIETALPLSTLSVSVGVPASEEGGDISPPRTPTNSRLDISPTHRRLLIETSLKKKLGALNVTY
jgi:hypothetical protein